MSLKWFHLLFIMIAAVMAIGVAVWAAQTGRWLLAFVALASGAALIVYRGIFVRKAANIGL